MTVKSTLLHAALKLVDQARTTLVPITTIEYDTDGEVSKDRDQHSMNIMTWLTDAADELEDWRDREKNSR